MSGRHGDPADDLDLDLLAALHATGSIEGDELVEFEARLAADPVARARVAALHEALASMGGSEAVEPPAHLKDAVMARLGSTPQVGAPEALDTAEVAAGPAPEELATVTPLRRRSGAARRGGPAAPPGQNRRRPLVALLAAAAAGVLVLGTGALGWTALQSRQQQQAVQAAVARVVDAPDAVTIDAAPDSAAGWTGAHVVYSPSERRVAVVDTSGVPELDDREYQLWFVSGDEARPAGTISEESVGAVLQGDMTGAAAVAVTVEPEGGSERPSGDPVATFSMGEA